MVDRRTRFLPPGMKKFAEPPPPTPVAKPPSKPPPKPPSGSRGLAPPPTRTVPIGTMGPLAPGVTYEPVKPTPEQVAQDKAVSYTHLTLPTTPYV